jgi:hypothetical protein
MSSASKKRKRVTDSTTVSKSRKTQAKKTSEDDSVSNTAPLVRLSSISKIHRNPFMIS